MFRKCAVFLMLIFVVVCNGLDSKAIDFKITAKSPINHILTHKNILYISTDNGEVEVWDLTLRKKIRSIILENITDIFDKSTPPRVFRTDTIDNKKILIISQDSPDKSNIFIYSDGIFEKIDLGDKSGIIKNAFFVNESEILLGVRSYEIMLYNIQTKKVIWSVRPDFEVFTDLNINGNLAISSTEGGKIYLIDIKNGEILKKLQGANFDYLYSLGSAENTILSAGRDKICGIYDINTGDFKRIGTKFMSFAVAISDDSTLGVVSYNENGDFLLFETQSLKNIAILKNINVEPLQVIFIDNVVATFSRRDVLFWYVSD